MAKKREPTIEDIAAAAKGVRELPENLEAEQALLGAILINNQAFMRVAPFLEGKHFRHDIHRRIFEVAGDLIAAGTVVNPITIKTFLPQKDKVGDMTVKEYVARLAAEAVTIINAYDFGRAIMDAWVRREHIANANALIDTMYDAPPDKPAAALASTYRDTMAKIDASVPDERQRQGAGRRYIENLRSAKGKKASLRGVPIAFRELQRVLGEDVFEGGNYYGFLASSGEGKTSLILQLMVHALRAGCPVQYQSFDQSDDQLIRQMVAQEYSIEARRQKIGDLSPVEYQDAERFGEWVAEAERTKLFNIRPCHKGEGAAQLVTYADDFVNTYRRRRKRDDEEDCVPLIITDHILAITPVLEDRKADPGTKARGINTVMKAAAQRNGAAWLVLNQRNTFGMRRDNPRPISEDLFGGDQAKQAYDAIPYLYRFKKFYDDRAKVSAKKDDPKFFIFPESVRNGSADIAEIGAIKTRFGDPNITETLDFEGRFTRYKSPVSEQQRYDQASLIDGF